MMEAGPCITCRGAYAEHFDEKGRPTTQHPYKTDGAELSTQRERAEALRKPAPPQQPQLKIAGTDGETIQRLIGLLLEKGVIDIPETLFILGVGPKPEKES